MMLRFKTIGILSVLLGLGGVLGDGVEAADLGNGYRGSDRCFLMRRSDILDLSSTEKMYSEVEKLYEHALEVSTSEQAIGSRSPRFLWSIEAKAACGKAIGYFKGAEINEEMISKCDCFHSRMQSF